MSASNRMKIIVPLVSAISLAALSAQAQEAGRTGGGQVPAAVQAPQQAAPPSNAPQAVRRGPPPQQAARPAPAQVGAVRPAVGSPPQAGYVARGPAPARVYGGHPYRGHVAWDGGRWRHETRNGRYGWWWDVGGAWYYYPERMAGPPAYISEEYIDDVPVAYAPPPAAYVPPPPPEPADPGASALGGAIVGGLLGGLISGNATGAAAGMVVGGATGAIAGATAASRPGYYWSQGNCYYRYPSGQYVLADSRACY